MNVPDSIRHAAGDLLAEYGLLIDEDRLEDWVELFDETCDYQVVTRENVEQGLPNVLIWCDNKAMLRDRVASYRNVNEYNLHWDRHVIGAPRFCGEAGGVWTVEAAYSLFQTDLEGASRLFSVGRYRIGFMLRDVGRRLAVGPQGARDLTHAVEQLTSLVGRVSLRELVRDTTDLVERHFIEAALELTDDNRTSAAEVLGVSRQSLYVKLRRHRLLDSADSTLTPSE